MPEALEPYRLALMASTGMALLFMIQSLVGFLSRLRSGQPGGVAISGGHERWLFRVDRARANTIEVLGNFALLMLLAIAFQAPATAVTVGAVLFLVARVAHMLFYYGNLQRPRSASFLLTNVAQFVLLVTIVRHVVLGA